MFTELVTFSVFNITLINKKVNKYFFLYMRMDGWSEC